jgi:origin recognition complex subunit 3
MRKFHGDIGDFSADQHPAISQAYQIFAEGGRMINLSDWYHSFASVRLTAGASNQGASDAGPQAGDMLEIQAQFARAVAELEYLGVLKHTNRKTDHALRLMYE